MASKRELVDRVQSLEEALEEARDLIDGVLAEEEDPEEFDPDNAD